MSDVAAEERPETQPGQDAVSASRRGRSAIIAYVILPVLVLAAALGVSFLKWQSDSVSVPTGGAAGEPVVAATEGVVAMLSYRADHVEQDLTAASRRMTGDFLGEYTTLINDVVIPGAQEQRISASTTVPAAAVISADGDRARVLVYINQTTTVGTEAPTDTQSSAHVDMQKVGDRWLIAGFEPI
ncbi:hypothetical protein [Mycolicibacterium parafortuitum]|uniref:hypothetical protein n=1 Tax=Mycolicibacterium parafortuitum TaxID=39692 RepID=UPI001E5E1EEE|nr:hypothetical protein [Mycolicibacterium parafortuitum]